MVLTSSVFVRIDAYLSYHLIKHNPFRNVSYSHDSNHNLMHLKLCSYSMDHTLNKLCRDTIRHRALKKKKQRNLSQSIIFMCCQKLKRNNQHLLPNMNYSSSQTRPNYEGRRKPENSEKTCESEHGLGIPFSHTARSRK